VAPLPQTYPGYRLDNAIRGALIYGGGDALAAWILGELGLVRLLGMATIGGTLYALEVPNWFRWIDRHAPSQVGWRNAIERTGLALIYFNPLWIARHLAFIAFFSGEAIGTGLIATGSMAFLANIPIALIANYLIQNALPPRHRFTASALYSAAMAVYYALSLRFFG
jgi:hypothetical protein